MNEEEAMDKYLSKKEYLQKYDSNVGYALYVQNNIKRDDYVRLNTGEIVKVTGIKENKLNKKAIYYGIYEQNWFDSMAVKNFSDKIIDLIEEGDYTNGYYTRKIANYNNELCVFDLNIMQWIPLTEIDVFYSIVTHEQFESIEYIVEEDK